MARIDGEQSDDQRSDATRDAGGDDTVACRRSARRDAPRRVERQQLRGYATKMLLLLPVTVLLTVGYTIDAWTMRQLGRPIHAGRVVAAEMRAFYGFVRRPVLTIESDDGRARGEAVLWMDGIDAFTGPVRFFDPGLASGEVQIDGETSSLWGALLFGVLPSSALVACWLGLRRGERERGQTTDVPELGRAGSRGAH
jgi:hypothetical protein